MYKSVIVPSLISEAIATDSERVGWGWMDKPISFASAPISIDKTVSAINSPAFVPTIAAPIIRLVSLSKINFVIPSVRFVYIALPLAAHGNTAFSIAIFFSCASSSVTPAHAISGSV